MKRIGNSLLLLVFLTATIFFAGCGVPFHKKLDTYMQAGDFKSAQELIDSEREKPKENIYQKDKNDLLYCMDKSVVAQALGQMDESTKLLVKADDIIDALYTKSLLDETYSLLSDETALKYRGEDIDAVMVSVLRILNFMYEGNYSDALIESRKINSKLKYFTTEYGDKAIYTEDAFARFLAGFCYEANGEYNDALIDYRLAAKTYEKYAQVYGTQMPDLIKAKTLAMAKASKFEDVFKEYSELWPDAKYDTKEDLTKKGELLVVVYEGLAPYRIEDKMLFTGMASPKMVTRKSAYSSIELVNGGKPFEAELAQDVGVMSAINLENKMGIIVAKGVGRMAAKSVAKNIPGLSLFVGEERADLRCWRTIPSRFYVARAILAPGKHTVTLRLTDAKTGVAREEKITADIKAGKKTTMPVYAF